MLPRATLIDVRRDPMACCVSNLKQLFARGQEFTYSSDSIARYYQGYVRLMRHWDDVLPGRVLHISYEEIVESFEATVYRLLDFCGLQPELGAGASAYLPHRVGPLAPVRALAGSAEGVTG